MLGIEEERIGIEKTIEGLETESRLLKHRRNSLEIFSRRKTLRELMTRADSIRGSKEAIESVIRECSNRLRQSEAAVISGRIEAMNVDLRGIETRLADIDRACEGNQLQTELYQCEFSLRTIWQRQVDELSEKLKMIGRDTLENQADISRFEALKETLQSERSEKEKEIGEKNRPSLSGVKS
jgi:hypothetical protein